ncbi:MAG TPA: HepT-like ribonuclease domain-containing protein [Candidatus Saccharimonadales bacterium]|nr:HepT-like ribonuclease domain-containing protein [Candidatus Saccharimonadales bacterium]
MGLDVARIKKKMESIREYGERITRILPSDFGAYSKSDYVVKAAVERNIQLISDAELDIVMLLYRGFELSIAGNESTMLDKIGVRLSGDVIKKIKERRDLRNNLVHAYADSYYDRGVFDQAKNMKDIEEFRKEVNKLTK